MAIVSAATGQPVNLIAGPNRALGPNLYQSDATTPTVEQLSSTGSIGWTSPASAIFGPGYDPGQGWNIWPVGSLNIGSIGATSKGTTVNLGTIKTVGFSIASGRPVWTVPGSYMCMGPLMFLDTQVACQYSGTAKAPKKAGTPLSLAGVKLKLVGFNPVTGAVSWNRAVSNVKALTSGDGLSFLDGTQLVVAVPGGKSVLLDTATGATTSVTRTAAFWCQRLPLYKVTAIKGAEGNGKRQAAPVYFPCAPDGRATSKLPANLPNTVGMTVNGVYVWPSPKGLQTHTVGISNTTA